ncbi:MAG TPA: hypothetical protein VFQ88_00100 [Nevskiaceae bacterium]|nr:hypothetical protein [Nevskiaceae bacterium]
MAATISITGNFALPVPAIPGSTGSDAIRAVRHSLGAIAPLLRQFPQTGNFLTAGVGGPVTDNGSIVQFGVRPARGWISEYPIFCALWAQPSSAEVVAAGRIAQGIFLAACVTLAEHSDLHAEYRSAVRAAGLAVRHVLNGDVSFGRSKILPAKSINDIWTLLVNLSASTSSAGCQRLAGLLTLVQYACDIARQPPVRIGATIVRQVAGHHTTEADDSTPSYRVLEQVPRLRVDEESRAPLPESTQRQVALLSLPAAKHPISQRQAYWRAAHKSRAIRAQAQGLLASSDRLQLVDLAALETACLAQLHGRPRNDDFMRGLALLALALVTGIAVRGLGNVHIQRGSTVNLNATPTVTTLCIDGGWWMRPVPALPQGFMPSDAERQRYRSAGRYLALPLPALACVTLMLSLLRSQSVIASQPVQHPATIGEPIRRRGGAIRM